MILIINVCKHKLHELEFVKPIEEILTRNEIKYSTKSYKEIVKIDLQKTDKIIICGTSLKDNDFIEDIDKFEWIKEFEKPILGICGGMQILMSVFCKCGFRRLTWIGEEVVMFDEEFLGIKKGKLKTYQLHQLSMGYIKKEFKICAKSNSGIQAIKHKTKGIYGVLFHPEVRNKELISYFCREILV